VTSGIKYRRRTNWSDRTSYGRSVVITVTRLTSYRRIGGPVGLGCCGWNGAAVTHIADIRVGKSRGRRTVKRHTAVDVRRLTVHRRVVRVRFVTRTAVRRTRRIRTVCSRTYMSVVGTTTNRTVAVTKGAVTNTRHRTPRVGRRGSRTVTKVVTIVRAAGTVSTRRKIKLAQVLGRERRTAYLNRAVRNSARYEVRVSRIVRMTRRTIDRQSERVRRSLVGTMRTGRRWITVTERTITGRTRIPVSCRARIRWIVTVCRRTRVVCRAGTVDKTVGISTSVMSAVVNLGVKTRNVHICVTTSQDPLSVRTRISSVVVIERTNTLTLNARMTIVAAQSNRTHVYGMVRSRRRITVTRVAVKTAKVVPDTVATCTRTVTRRGTVVVRRAGVTHRR
jgi:hypothetical protein